MAASAIFFFTACAPKKISVSPRVIEKKEIKGRFLPAKAIRISDILSDSIQNFFVEPDMAYRERLIDLFQSESSPMENYRRLKSQFPEAEGRGELNYLFFRFSHAPAFQPFKKKGNSYKAFVRAWVEDALSSENPKLRNLYSQHYPDIKPSSLHYFSFVAESQQIAPGEDLSVRSLGLHSPKNSVQLNFLIEKRQEASSLTSEEKYQLVEADRRTLSGRRFEFKKKMKEPGIYRLTIYNAYFFKEIKFYVSSLNISAKNDGELMMVWGFSSSPQLKAPYKMIFESHGGKKWETSTDPNGLAYVLKDVIGPDSLLSYKISLEKDHHYCSMEGLWNEIKTKEKILYPHAYTDKSKIPLGSSFNYRIAMLEKNPETGFGNAPLDSLKIQLVNQSDVSVMERIIAPEESGVFEDSLQIPVNLEPGYYSLFAEWARWEKAKKWERFNGGGFLKSIQITKSLLPDYFIQIEGLRSGSGASGSSFNIELKSENSAIPFGEELIVLHFGSDMFPSSHVISDYLKAENMEGKDVLTRDTLIIPPNGKINWIKRRKGQYVYEWLIAKAANAKLNVKPEFKLIKGANSPIVNIIHETKIALADNPHRFLISSSDEELISSKNLKVQFEKNGGELESSPFKFSKIGSGEVDFTPTEPGIYHIALNGVLRGKAFKVKQKFFVPRYYGEGLSEEDCYVMYDKPSYAIGDSVFVKIYIGILNGKVLLTRESNQIQDVLVADIQNHSGTIAFPLNQNRYENPNWNLSWQKEGKFYTGNIQLPLEEEFQKLQANLVLNSPPAPGSELESSLELKNHESKQGVFFYSLIPKEDVEATQWVINVSKKESSLLYEPHQKNYIRTQFSKDIFPEFLPIQIVGRESLRFSNFNPGAFSEPVNSKHVKNSFRFYSDWMEIRNKSKYPIQIQLPDKSGEWLLHVWGYNAMGPLSLSLPVALSGDININSSAPHKLHAGDEFFVETEIENTQTQAVEGILETNLLEISTNSAQTKDSTLYIDRGEQVKVIVPFKAAQPGQYKLNTLYKQGSHDYVDSQALEIYGNDATEVLYGYLYGAEKNSRNFNRIKFKSPFNPGSKIIFSAFPGISSWLTYELVNRLSHSEGILETANTVQAAMHFLVENPKHTLANEIGRLWKLQMDSYLISVMESQNKDGGWSFDAGEKSIPELSAYILQALSVYKNKMGQELSSSLNQCFLEAIGFLQSSLKNYEEGQVEHAFMLYALAISGNTGEVGARVNQLSKERIPYSPPAAAYYLGAAKICHQNKAADKFLEVLERQVIEIKSEVSWSGDLHSAWFKNHIESSAIILGILAEFEPKHRFTQKVLPYLSRKWLGNGWGSEKTTSVIFIAIAKACSLVNNKVKMEVKNFTNGKKTQQFDLENENLNPIHFTLDNLDRSSQGEFIFGFDGRGDLLYNIKLYNGNSQEISNRRKDLWNLSKNYKLLQYQKNGKDSWELKSSPRENYDVGDEIEVNLELNSEIDLRFVEIRDALPAGCNLIHRDSSWSQKLNLDFTQDKFEKNETQGYVSHKIQFLPAGKHQFRYYLKAIHPGNYHARESQICEWLDGNCDFFDYPQKIGISRN